MITFKCDMCGKYFEYKKGEYNGIMFGEIDPDNFSDEDLSERYDLCPDCINSILDKILKDE